MTYIETLLSTIDTQIQHYTFDAYHSLVSTLYPTLLILLVLYFAGLGWLFLRGLLPLSPLAIAWHVFRVTLIFILATNWDYFSLMIANVFTQFPDHVLASLLGKVSNSEVVNQQTITTSLAHIWQSGINIFTNVWRTSGPDFFLGTIFGLLGYAMVMLIIGIPLFYLVMAKLALSLLLVLAPLMLPMFLWEATRAIFNGWLRLLIKWAILPLFIYIFIAFYLVLIQGQISNLGHDVSTASISTFVLLSLVVIATFLQAAKMATDIARNINVNDIRIHPHATVPTMMYKVWRQPEVS